MTQTVMSKGNNTIDKGDYYVYIKTQMTCNLKESEIIQIGFCMEKVKNVKDEEKGETKR